MRGRETSLLDPLEYEAIEEAEDALNRFIERRAQQAKREEAEETFWKASERKHREQQQEQRRQEWIRYHNYLADHHEQMGRQLAEEHRRRAYELKNGKSRE